jgi:hypothetical protein
VSGDERARAGVTSEEARTPAGAWGRDGHGLDSSDSADRGPGGPEAEPVSEDTRAAIARLLEGSPIDAMPERLRARGRDVAAKFAAERAALDLDPGAVVGPYVVVRLLGTGGQARVYHARHAATGHEVALKVPRVKVAKRLARESEILLRLDHPRIVSIEEADLEGPIPYLATEYLRGGSLADLLAAARGRRLPRDRVETIAIAVLEALEFAHARGVVHRDIKPANILFDDEGEAKVADFGIGKVALLTSRGEAGVPATLSKSATVFAGTPVYMAPEQEDPSRGEGGRVDGRADLFSLGKLVYECLTGHIPRTIRPVTLDRDDVPPGWNELLFHLVEERPEDRIATAAEAMQVVRYLVRRGAELDAAREAGEGGGHDDAWTRGRGAVAAEARAFDLGYRQAKEDLDFAAGLGRTLPALTLAGLGLALLVIAGQPEGLAEAVWGWVPRARTPLTIAGAGLAIMAGLFAATRWAIVTAARREAARRREGASGGGGSTPAPPSA